MTDGVPHFSKLGADAHHLLKESFPGRGFELSTSVSTANNYVASSSFTKKGGKVAGRVGLWFKGSNMVFDYKWLTNNKCNGMAKSAYTHTVTVTVKGPVGPARGKFEVNTNKNGETTFEPSVSFANHTAAVDVSTHFALEKKAFTSITSEAVFKYPENTFWGTKLTYDLDRKVLMGKTAVEVAKPFHKINFSLTKQGDLLTAGHSWYQIVSRDVILGARLSLDANLSAHRRGTKASVGGVWLLDDDTALRGKWSVVQPVKDAAQFRVGLAVEQKVTSYARVHVGVDLNASKFAARTDAVGDHNFGFKLSFE